MRVSNLISVSQPWQQMVRNLGEDSVSFIRRRDTQTDTQTRSSLVSIPQMPSSRVTLDFFVNVLYLLRSFCAKDKGGSNDYWRKIQV